MFKMIQCVKIHSETKAHISPNTSTRKFAGVITSDMLNGMKHSSALNRFAFNVLFLLIIRSMRISMIFMRLAYDSQ